MFRILSDDEDDYIPPHLEPLTYFGPSYFEDNNPSKSWPRWDDEEEEEHRVFGR
jgi:hypothetical protein